MAIDVEKMYRTYGPMVLRRCRQLLRSEERARDAMQEVFVRLLRSADRITDQYPSSLLYRMATNVSLNVIRADKTRREVDSGDELLDSLAGVDDRPERFEWRSVLGRVLGGQQQSTRYIAVLHFVDGLTHEEVAREVRMSVSGVRKRLRLLRERVRAIPGLAEDLRQ